MRTATIAVLALAGVLAGCASAPKMSDADRAALYRSHAGAPVKSFLYSGSLDQWRAVDDRSLAVWVTPTRAFLLELTACPDLKTAHAIAIKDTVGQVSTFDRVLPLGTGMPVSCRIDRILPLDVKAIREDEKRAAQAR